MADIAERVYRSVLVVRCQAGDREDPEVTVYACSVQPSTCGKTGLATNDSFSNPVDKAVYEWWAIAGDICGPVAALQPVLFDKRARAELHHCGQRRQQLSL
jgi:hypothetical protein